MEVKARAGVGAEGRMNRNPLDPLLMRLAHDYVDDRDLADKLVKLFLVRNSAPERGAVGKVCRWERRAAGGDGVAGKE